MKVSLAHQLIHATPGGPSKLVPALPNIRNAQGSLREYGVTGLKQEFPGEAIA